jgi:polyisoprenoid-binding protein YceI
MNCLTNVRWTSLMLAAVSLAVVAADTNIDAAKSTLVATFKQEGVPVDAPFHKFSGYIAYDAKNVAAATAKLDVDTASLDIGDEMYNAEVRKPAWFDTARFPTATFRSTAIKPVAAGKLEATGTLTIKGKAVTLAIPITVTANAFDGALVISRKAFGIGDPAWNDVLEDKVSVKFHLVSPGR